MSTQHTSEMNAAQKRWADGLKQLEAAARNAKQAEAIDVLHAACQEMTQLRTQRDDLLAALRIALDVLDAHDDGFSRSAAPVVRAAIAKAEGLASFALSEVQS